MSYVAAVIGGTGLCDWQGAERVDSLSIDTPYGHPSADLLVLRQDDLQFVFLARHGRDHHLPPHKVNYRANLWALKSLDIDSVLAVNVVGGIGEGFPAGRLAVPDQIVDYTWGREHTFYEGGESGVEHVDFSWPYTESLRQRLLAAASEQSIPVAPSATYGATQGPRLESAAEIRRMARDGCDLVGMTGMPETGLARELGLDYASLSLVVNPAAGETDAEITMEEIHAVIDSGMDSVRRILSETISSLARPG